LDRTTALRNYQLYLDAAKDALLLATIMLRADNNDGLILLPQTKQMTKNKQLMETE
jgi:hypothetical protein